MRVTKHVLLLAGVCLSTVPTLHASSVPAQVLAWLPQAWQRQRQHIPSHARLIGAAPEDVVYKADGEGPQYIAEVGEFWMDRFPVTNARFAEFVADTAHRTSAEKGGSAFVFKPAMEPDAAAAVPKAASVKDSEWWVVSDTARWWAPEGDGTDLSTGVAEAAVAAPDAAAALASGAALTPDTMQALAASATAQGLHRLGRQVQPVVQVSALDAAAFCAWDGGRLPSEEEWEAAARGPKQGRQFPWGNKWRPHGQYRANTWQGQFPSTDSGADGFRFLAPVQAAGDQNAWGLVGMVGNVWEWSASAWCNTTALRLRGVADQTCYYELARLAAGDQLADDTVVPGPQVVKGCSFMCHRAVNDRARPAARRMHANSTSLYEVGFRCAYDEPFGEWSERHEPPPAPGPLPKPRAAATKAKAEPVVEHMDWDAAIEDVDPEPPQAVQRGSPLSRPPVDADAHAYQAASEDTRWRDENLHADMDAFDQGVYEEDFRMPEQDAASLRMDLHEMDRLVRQAAEQEEEL